MVKNLPSNAEDEGLIPGQGTKIPHAMGQLSLNKRACMSQTTEPMPSGVHVPQLERENPYTTTRGMLAHQN